MVRLVGLPLLLVFGSACGRHAGPEAGVTYFWHVTSSSLEVGQCSDEPDFRSQLQPLAVGANTYLIYKVEKDARHATVLKCATLDAATCAPDTPSVVFSISGAELDWSGETRTPVGSSGCTLLQSQSWTFLDQDTKFSVDMTIAFSLVDNPAVCARVDSDLKTRSANGLGVTGCAVVFKLGGELR